MNGTKQPYDLPEDAVWFITGCSSGIGRALAEHVVSQNQRLVATARQISALSYLPNNSPNVLKLSLDVSSPTSIDAAVATALSRFHRLDVVVNNAGYAIYGDTENASLDTAHKLMETNFWGTVGLTTHAMRIMREQRPQGGVVMNVTSQGGRTAYQGHAFYHASKFAVEGFTESVSKEVLPKWNIHFCLIEPGGVKTGYVDKGMVMIPNHPAYGDDSPTRVLERYIKDPEMSKSWADAGKVAETMWEVVNEGGDIPLRVPLGPDAWAGLMAENEQQRKELEAGKERAIKVGNAGQAESIAFLINQK
ncbi:short-chain dehydrogenase/reductase-like protein SDR [Cercophora newfieldiana]|uniref:Short-chain dehydrogenase/reductase-like protein SDR n=1 Tax=Cercophora newfieldiana TaxID=92897 RepID=A0AA40CLD3_9PEZI|nr:short-chain dehydrogenase/reductase-like protein SDR [Cercophora newfieldiana]